MNWLCFAQKYLFNLKAFQVTSIVFLLAIEWWLMEGLGALMMLKTMDKLMANFVKERVLKTCEIELWGIE